jgi:hypothetical protein
MPETEVRRPGLRLVEVAIVVVVLVIAVSLIPPAIYTSRVPDYGGTSQSINNLKQLGMAVHEIADRCNGTLPPSVGIFPAGGTIKGTLFFHMLSDVEQDNIYVRHKGSPADCTETVKTYCAALDPTNPGNQNLTSYASNAAVFGLGDGDRTIRHTDAFKQKGASNTILFMERYAVVGPEGVRHTCGAASEIERLICTRLVPNPMRCHCRNLESYRRRPATTHRTPSGKR